MADDQQQSEPSELESKIGQQLSDLAGSVERLAVRAQNEFSKPPSLRKRIVSQSFEVGHLDTLPTDGRQPLAIFSEFEVRVHSLPSAPRRSLP